MPGEPKDVSISLGLDAVDDEQALRVAVARKLRMPESDLGDVWVRRRSIDARRNRVAFDLLVRIGTREETPLPPLREVDRGSSRGSRVVIVGDGPAGLFCAYQLARSGVASIVLDRGHKVQPRRRDLKKLNQNGLVDPDSNYCFGEGGAGTYSDGKLYTRANKRGNVADVIAILASAGAPEDIRVDARPHIGSNKLPKVVTELREQLEARGVEFRFEAKVTGLEIESGRAAGVVLDGGEVVEGREVVIATGHSARDVYTFLAGHGVRLEAKPFALGVRIEHPQPLINEIQYGRVKEHPRLPAASYRLATQARERGVFSFCMCPGGWIVPAATEPGALVVNGMSLSRRDSPFANSGMVVALEVEDFARAGFEGPLAGVELQRQLEQAAFDAGGGELRAPATRLTDFIVGRSSSTVPKTSYIPGLAASNIADVLEVCSLGIASRLREGLQTFGSKLRGFMTQEAVLVGLESRTSSPVRVPRGDDLTSPDVEALYPCGEGAGYAGGIMSAALDGMRVADAIIRARVTQ